jgi:alkylation response protein AidB-like acyl-CoA dehydrogenase
MDFEFSDEQTTIRELAGRILDGEATSERAKVHEASGLPYDALVWSKLADAGLLGIALPEAQGGMGYGFAELCVLLEEVGRRVAPVPVFESLVSVGLTLAEFGTTEQRERWLPGIAVGTCIATIAASDAHSGERTPPSTTARADAAGFVLEGTKRFVVLAEQAGLMLVPACDAERTRWFLLEPDQPGVQVTRTLTTLGLAAYDVVLDAVHVGADRVLGGIECDGDAVAAWLKDRELIAAAALQVGVSAGALDMTAAYVRERLQFGVPIGSFQAVQHRCADCFIDLQAMRWTMWSAAWRVAEGRGATDEARVAKFWACEGGTRIANAAMHLHAGIGSDVDYPIHRYFLWSKAIELRRGSATRQLVALGDDLAEAGIQEQA